MKRCLPLAALVALLVLLLVGCAPSPKPAPATTPTLTPATASPTPSTPAATASPALSTPAATPSFLSEADTIAIYATVICRLCTRDDSFGGTYKPEIVYLVRQTNDAVGDRRAARGTPVVLPEAVQSGIGVALADLRARVAWVNSSEDVPKDARTNEVQGHDVIVTLGNILPQEDGAVHVPASIYVAGLAAAGQTYVLQKENGAWVVKGNTGVQWIS